MIDDMLPMIENMQSEGAVVVLKWDGQRAKNRCTVIVTRADTDFVFRQDSDEMTAALGLAISDYRTRHSR